MNTYFAKVSIKDDGNTWPPKSKIAKISITDDWNSVPNGVRFEVEKDLNAYRKPDTVYWMGERIFPEPIFWAYYVVTADDFESACKIVKSEANDDYKVDVSDPAYRNLTKAEFAR